jgi:hypothetical protein
MPLQQRKMVRQLLARLQSRLYGKARYMKNLLVRVLDLPSRLNVACIRIVKVKVENFLACVASACICATKKSRILKGPKLNQSIPFDLMFVSRI